MKTHYIPSSINNKNDIESTAYGEKCMLFVEINDNYSTIPHSTFHNKDYELISSEFYEPLFVHDNKGTYKLEKLINFALENLPYNYLYNQKIKTRLLDLIDTDGMGDWEEQPSLGSIKYFIGFINAYKPKYPDIVISPQGNTKVEWHKNNNNLFTLEFFPNGSCKFLHFYTDEINHGRVNRIGGQITVNTLDDYLKQEKIKNLTRA